MKRISQHKMLLSGKSFEHCQGQVARFFNLTTLVIYDHIEASRELSVNGLDPNFSGAIHAAEDKNRQMVRSLAEDLIQSGYNSLAELIKVPQGYESKTLHILAHFLDGFIGIDSYFYNLPDDSHWLTPQIRQRIEDNPEKYWLIHLDCFADSAEHASILHG